MIRNFMPEAFEDHDLKIKEILLAPMPETAKLNRLIDYLRTF